MTHENEYHDNLVTMLELIWGEGYMAPGGPGNVAKMLSGLDTKGKRVLDIGCGKGDLYPRMVELLGQESADYFVENCRAMVVVCDKGEMRQGYCRGRRPGQSESDFLDFLLVAKAALACAAFADSDHAYVPGLHITEYLASAVRLVLPDRAHKDAVCQTLITIRQYIAGVCIKVFINNCPIRLSTVPLKTA